MLQIIDPRPPVNTSATPDRPARTLTGRRLNRLLKGASPRDRALIANDLARGTVQLRQPTYAQAAALARVSTGYVATVGRLTAEERLQLARGFLSLPCLHHRRRSDRALDRVAERYGVAALWRALERATAPIPSVAAA